ncbi:MAG: hypothetical protein RLZZ519_3162 [Bacteroidota bacterium]|jgi:putative spermidine/putrescine transport system permease protein
MRQKAFIIGFILLTVGPMAAGFTYSLLYSLGLAGLLGKGFTLRHWETLLTSSEIWSSLGYALTVTLISLALMLLLALPVAYLLHFKPSSRGMYASLFFPLTIPPLVAGFAWYQIMSPAGLLSRGSHSLGLTDGVEGFPRWVNDFANVGVLTTHVFLLFPFFTLVFLSVAKKENLSGLRSISATLGASPSQFFFRIFTPLLLRRSSSLLLLYGVFLFGMYEVPLLLGRSTPRAVTVLIVDKVSKFDLSGIPVGHAMAVLYTLLVGSFVTFLIWRKTKMAGQGG